MSPASPSICPAHLAHILNPVDFRLPSIFLPPSAEASTRHTEAEVALALSSDAGFAFPQAPQSPQDNDAAAAARWDADARRRHSRACSGKTRLSIQEKLDIICLYYSSDAMPSSSRRAVHQWDIALRYGKSRAAISKLLKPEHARKVIASAEGGRIKNRSMILQSIREEAERKSRSEEGGV
ncbi:hypothetical protein GUITHDRAFT_121300 [Guillardia theta CCMP2712]|uniref:Uncharacterized protein n=1 Tax=Guillardia theta (strain CCMP2712) TaxID=905079 RepID=L1I9D0_GUITC|nr:hypothetical protein GUITHDRAFT_121300 [Guillardia theta CCMP2712]EKX32514.1 hypothetical protein GUITHDRAFT_121300 [Guillardia theta CCMP2712]|eukprot:XP_005819494.1 hypothetical protein GUITHDRAFT_121300 [Guillardia theta CCMP2712]